MKTTFLSGSQLPDRFKNHIKYYETINDDQLKLISDWVIKIHTSTIKDSKRREGLVELSKSTDLAAENLIPIINSLTYAAHIIVEFNDQPDDFVDDLTNENLISESSAEKIRTSLKQILENRSIWHAHVSEELGLVLPVFDRIFFKCILSPVNEFEDPEKRSDTVKMKPAVIVNIITEKFGEDSNFSFVLDEEKLIDFIDELNSAKNKLEKIKQ